LSTIAQRYFFVLAQNREKTDKAFFFRSQQHHPTRSSAICKQHVAIYTYVGRRIKRLSE